ncbi:hypothetical protein BX600DRAFT_63987 [Xylariales sp. PMI_506]|nr:hypothetical protein BX600DRAFT_63987 [Xylariales sp. PMI_506]
MSQRNTSDVYTGPRPREMIANHTLAKEIIERHNDPCPILDDHEIAFLGEFVADPSQRTEILEKRGLLASDDSKVKESGSLVAHIVYHHGSNRAALTNDEIVALKQWYDGDGPNTE